MLVATGAGRSAITLRSLSRHALQHMIRYDRGSRDKKLRAITGGLRLLITQQCYPPIGLALQ